MSKCDHPMSARRLNGGDGREWCAICGNYMTASKEERQLAICQAELASERARRIKAEEALQEHKRIMRMHMTNCPNFRYAEVRKTIGQKQLEEDESRAQYPRVEKETK